LRLAVDASGYSAGAAESAAAILHEEAEEPRRAAVEAMLEHVNSPYQAEVARRLDLHCVFAIWPSVTLALVLDWDDRTPCVGPPSMRVRGC
jgi:hypothetical protein